MTHRYYRKDFSLPTTSNERIQVSHYFLHENDEIIQTPVMVYCHCNAGNRLEGLDILPFLVQKKISLVSFDFRGTGNSDGDFVTLGEQEKEDIETIVDYLIRIEVKSFFLWGRSMGGASVLKFKFQ